MGVPTSEVGYTSAMPRKKDHEVHKRTCGGMNGGEIYIYIYIYIYITTIFLYTLIRKTAILAYNRMGHTA